MKIVLCTALSGACARARTQQAKAPTGESDERKTRARRRATADATSVISRRSLGRCRIVRSRHCVRSTVVCVPITKKYGLLCCHAARLCGHYHGPHPQVRHRTAVCTRPARPRVPTSTTTTLSDNRRDVTMRTNHITQLAGADLQAGARRRVLRGQDRQWQFAQHAYRFYQHIYRLRRVASSPLGHICSLVSTSSLLRSSYICASDAAMSIK